MKTIYFDNAATAPIKYWNKDYAVFGNPNSTHAIGREANKALEEARTRIKNALGVKGGKVLFCRCASEAAKELSVSFLFGDKVCSEYEHDSVLNPCLGCDIPSAGYPEYIEGMKCYGEKEFLYLHQYVNNITGTVFDIESIGKMCKEHGAFFGSDFTSAIGHTSIPKNLEDFCDIVWFSGHKISAEQGIGAIWLSEKCVNYIGEDYATEEKMFSGTPNVSGAVAMSYALEHAVNPDVMDDRIALWKKLINHLIYKLDLAEIPFNFVTPTENYTPAINAITFPGINADALATFLSSKGIYISAGHSACENNSQDATRVLEAFGLTKQEASETVRISFNEDNTIEEIDAFAEGVKAFRNMFC